MCIERPELAGYRSPAHQSRQGHYVPFGVGIALQWALNTPFLPVQKGDSGIFDDRILQQKWRPRA